MGRHATYWSRLSDYEPSEEIVANDNSNTGTSNVPSDSAIHNPPASFSDNAHVKSLDEYHAIYERSMKDPEQFWAEQAEQRITWFKKWHTVKQCDYSKAQIAWYLGGKLNASYNCVDRHVEAGRGDTVQRLSGKATTRLRLKAIPMPNCTSKFKRLRMH